MKIILFGATGMVGQGVLRECLLDTSVEKILAIGRTPTGSHDPRLTECIQTDLFNVAAYESQLQGYDACFFCLGVSVLGTTEAAYHHMTITLTLDIAKALARASPQLTLIYVSGAGTDSTEHGAVCGRATLRVARDGALKSILDAADINALQGPDRRWR